MRLELLEDAGNGSAQLWQGVRAQIAMPGNAYDKR